MHWAKNAEADIFRAGEAASDARVYGMRWSFRRVLFAQGEMGDLLLHKLRLRQKRLAGGRVFTGGRGVGLHDRGDLVDPLIHLSDGRNLLRTRLRNVIDKRGCA